MRAVVPSAEPSATAFGRSSSPDDPEHERVPRRVAEHEDEALEDRDHVQLPELDRARQRQDCERAGCDDRERLRHEQEAAQVEAVDHRADRKAEERHRQELGKGERSDGERRSGQVEHEPVRGDLLHPRADERDTVADEVEPVVAVAPQAARRSCRRPTRSRLTSEELSRGRSAGRARRAVALLGRGDRSVTASTPSSGARISSGGRSGRVGNQSRADRVAVCDLRGAGSSSRLEHAVLGREHDRSRGRARRG